MTAPTANGPAGASAAERNGRPGSRRAADQGSSPLLALGHLLAGLVSFGAGIGAGVYTARLADAGGPLALWRTTLPAEGMVILAVSVAWLLSGAILHSLVAWRRGVRLADGWRTAGGLLAYNIVVGLLAVPLADLAGTYDGTGSDYGWTLGCLLWLPSLFTVAGTWFLSAPKRSASAVTPTSAVTPASGDAESAAGEDPGADVSGLFGTLSIFMINLAMLLSWVPAWAFFSGILLGNADRYMLPPLIPAGTMRIAAVGVVVGVPSILIYLLRRRFVAVLLWDQINPRHLGWSGLVLLVAALLAVQVARFVDPGVVYLVLFGSVLFFYGWFLRYLHRRFPQPEDWNPLD